MKALLINPWIEDFAAYDFWLKPLGLLYVGSYLKKLGFEVFLIDLMNRHDKRLHDYVQVPKDKFYKTGKFPYTKIEKPSVLSFVPRTYKRYGAPKEYFYDKLREIGKVDIVFVTSTLTYWYPGYWETIKTIKQVLGRKVPIVFGGFYVRNLPYHAKKSGAYIFSSSELNLLPKVLSNLLDVDLSVEVFDWFEELEPAYDLYENVGYLVLTTTLGCTFRCTYCIAHRIWNKIKFREIFRTVETIEKYVNYFDVKDVVFFDDAILVNSHKHFKPLLKELIKKDLKVNYHLPNGIHARLLDKETAELLKEAGFKTIKLGYETSGDLQIKTGGKVVDRDLIKAARLLRDVGFTEREVSAYIMINIPDQKEEEVVQAMKICREEGIGFSLNEYTPIVGTDDWIELVNKGALRGNEDPVLLNNTVLPFWWKYGMDEKKIQFLKQKARELKS
ncbi:radical SAM protein [Thermosipho ferrireducens]|uniref:Radical SAM protein n=1 Tax=Thermosipho ferrireducens TaxID=2571116 RepID=A0ABX7S6V4_9BACT|nr:radical SAM protein [Thermosipho ferrireducens]QTA37337.1 radical SAM protein [Thermosipho ferrireducens]